MQSYVIALYIRLSIEDSRYDSLSIESQRLILREHAASLPEAAEAVVWEFVDNGYSGANFERPQVQKLIGMVRENKIDCIMVKDFSRFGRNSLETGYFIERVFPLFHTRFISVSDDFDTDRLKGDTGGMDVAFKYLISEYYSRDMSVKTRSAKYAKMERGEYQSKICPYGYRKGANGRMEPDPEAAVVVRQIFSRAAGGMSAARIAAELSRQGIPTPGEYKAAHGNHTHDISRTHGVWCNATVLRILDDERYTGTYVIGKRAVLEIGGTRRREKDRKKWFIIPDHHEPLIGKELFEQVQASARRFSLPVRKHHAYPLRGKVICGCCGHALARMERKTSYYLCRHSEADERFSCHGLKVLTDDLEQAVFDTLKCQVKALESDLNVLPAEALIPGWAEYDRQIEGLLDDKLRLYERYLHGEVERDAYKAEMFVYDERLRKMKNARSAWMAHAEQTKEADERRQNRERAIREVAEAGKLTDALSELLIEKVFVFPGNRIEIAYKTQDIFS
jgi:DNA invertase Pin-like site-specific DNA recombinase